MFLKSTQYRRKHLGYMIIDITSKSTFRWTITKNSDWKSDCEESRHFDLR